MIVFPNAKINLGLYVTGRRTDGYHNIESLFYPVDWKDALEIVEGWENRGENAIAIGNVLFSSSGIEISGSAAGNLCLKVYQELAGQYSLPKIQMHLHKNIPIGAGLGGGSSDAAFCLKLLIDMFGLPLNEEAQLALLLRLGSDCPFFWHNRPMLALGRGEILAASTLDLSGLHILLVNPGIHISTAEAYAGIAPSPTPIDLSDVSTIADLREKDIHNQFEKSIFPKHPLIADIKTMLLEMGAMYAAMTGSGSTVFGIFKDRPKPPEQLKALTIHQGIL